MQSVEQTLQTKLASRPIRSDARIWMVSAIFGSILSIVIGFYYYLLRGSLMIETVNMIFADVAFILVGCSFLLGALCYFWNFADGYICYRKHVGLTGFLFGCTHVLISLLVYPAFTRFERYSIDDEFYLKFLYGLIAFAIFSMMAVISNQFAVHELGGILWRRLLRVGYIGYFFVLLHFVPATSATWINWIEHVSVYPRLPPFSLILFLFGLIVLMMRILVFISASSVFHTRQSNTTP